MLRLWWEHSVCEETWADPTNSLTNMFCEPLSSKVLPELWKWRSAEGNKHRTVLILNQLLLCLDPGASSSSEEHQQLPRRQKYDAGLETKGSFLWVLLWLSFTRICHRDLCSVFVFLRAADILFSGIPPALQSLRRGDGSSGSLCQTVLSTHKCDSDAK